MQAPYKKNSSPLPPPKKVQSQVPCPNTDATISADCQHSLCYELHPASRRFLGVVQLKTSVYFQRGFLVFVPLTSVETLYFTCEERCGKCLNWQKQEAKLLQKHFWAVNPKPIIMFGLTLHRSLHFGEAPL